MKATLIIIQNEADHATAKALVGKLMRSSEAAGEIADVRGVVARARGMSQLADETGLTRQALYKALSSDGNPEFATVLKVIRALGFRLHAGPASAA